MGAEQFWVSGQGKDAEEAFYKLVAQACYDHGHSGYTGTIGEKLDYVKMGTAKTLDEAREMADLFLEKRDPRIEDKWGPAGMIEIKLTHAQRPTTFYFFGWASS